MPLKTSDTFLMSNTGGAYNPAGSHLMVCLVARTPAQLAIIVPIVSLRDGLDTSCCLYPGDHPFIKHDSCASYDFARAIPTDKINADIASGEITLKDSVSSLVLERLQIGFVHSDELAPWIYEAAHGDILVAALKKKGLL